MDNTKELFSLVSKNMKKIRNETINKSLEKVAEEIGMSRSFLSQFECAKGDKGISLDTLYLISQKYNFDIRKFFEGYENLLVKCQSKNSRK